MRVLVIGTGSIGRRHAANLEALGAAAVPVSVRGAGLGGIERAIAGGPDGAVIATATDLRLPLVAACADAGLPMYVEKPVAVAPGEVEAVLAAAAPVAARSLAGFMMRYHPAVRHLAEADLSGIYRHAFEIGHDVRAWRSGWRFANSYAARPAGGGVLLDLCHEIDMAELLFPGAAMTVASIGHPACPGVDMASLVTRAGPHVGTVAMDYLAPRLHRRITLLGLEARYDFDLAAERYVVETVAGDETLNLPVERNALFLAAMRDFLALVAGRAPSAEAPRLDLVAESSRAIAAAWAARRFGGMVEGFAL